MKWCLALLVLVGCASGQFELKEWMKEDGRIKVVATVAMVADLVKAVGDDEVDVIVLIKGDLDPHSYQLVKGDDEKLVRADLIIASGMGLEHGPTLQSYLKESPKAYVLGNEILKKYPELALKVGGVVDPHIWMDLSLYAKTIPVIVEALSKARPEKATHFHDRGERLRQELLSAHEKAKAILHEVPENKRYLITSHDAFNYFTRAYLAEPDEIESGEWQKRFDAPEGLAPDSQLSQKDIFDILQHLEKYHITVIFPESNVSSDSLRKIQQAAREKGLTISMGNPYLYGDAMGPPGSDGDTYIKMILHNAKTIAEDLKGEGVNEER
jgi:manganese/zinc/iron transport system substrate-binding protein